MGNSMMSFCAWISLIPSDLLKSTGHTVLEIKVQINETNGNETAKSNVVHACLLSAHLLTCLSCVTECHLTSVAKKVRKHNTM